MSNPRLDPEVAAEAKSQRDEQRQKQPYASELDNRELEHAHREERPVDPKNKSAATGQERKPT